MSRLIAIEGANGVGKSTLAKSLTEYLSNHGHVVVATREPGGTPRAEEIRTFMLSEAGQQLAPGEQLRRIHEGQTDHVCTKIAPALAAGQFVITDRFELSSWVYQVWQDRTLEDEFQSMSAEIREALGGQTAEYLFCQAPTAVVHGRLHGSNQARNHFDATDTAGIEDRQTVYQTGLTCVRGIFHTIKADTDPDEVLRQALIVLQLDH